MNLRGGLSLFVVWIDGKRARMFHFSADRMERQVYSAAESGEIESSDFFDLIASKLEFARRIVVLGPGTVNARFLRRLQEHHPRVARCVVASESSDHPSDGEIASYAARYLQKQVAS